ncbi:unnamed protein product [Rotaria sp. Silwood2]|nr:unnamed protein product [Rotaria sp. Silwood2]
MQVLFPWKDGFGKIYVVQLTNPVQRLIHPPVSSSSFEHFYSGSSISQHLLRGNSSFILSNSSTSHAPIMKNAISNNSIRLPPPRYQSPPSNVERSHSTSSQQSKTVNNSSVVFDHEFSRLLYGKDTGKTRRQKQKRKAFSDPVKKSIEEASRSLEKTHRRITPNLNKTHQVKEEEEGENDAEIETKTDRKDIHKQELNFPSQRRSQRKSNLSENNLIPANSLLKQRIPSFLRVYSQASPSNDILLQWHLFNLSELESFNTMMSRLYKNENLARVQLYEIYRTALLSMLASKKSLNTNSDNDANTTIVSKTPMTLIEKILNENSHVHIHDDKRAYVEETIQSLINDGRKMLHVVADFDFTLTIYEKNGVILPSTFGVIESNDRVKLPDGSLLSHKAEKLRLKYHPIEMDVHMDVSEKIPYMIEWWRTAQNLFIVSNLNKSSMRELVHESTMELKKGVHEFIIELLHSETPILIFSAGLGDVIELFLEKEIPDFKHNHESSHIVSNFINYDNDGKLLAFSDKVIHSFNKNEHEISDTSYYQTILTRPNVILLGDSLGDVGMIGGMKNLKQILKIGYLNQSTPEKLVVYKNVYDIVYFIYCFSLVRWLVGLILIIASLITLAPLLFRLYGDFILTKMLFQTWTRYYPWIDLTKLDSFSLNGINVYEKTEPNVKVGLWYVLPSTVEVNHSLPTLVDHLKAYVKSTDQPIIMYLHGQDGTRATHYRANHYRMMTNFGNHIIALDYRGYGDSTGIPSMHGVVHDVLHVFKLIRQVCPDNPITIWGHSMGTGVALLTMNYLFKNHTDFKKPSGLVLEAPFYNTMQAFVSYPITRILKINPYFMQAALDAFTTVELDFPNNEIIPFLPLPIVIIHAEDDAIIPYFHLELIQDYVKEHRDPNLPPIRYITVPRSAGCGHNHIYSYPKFEEIVTDFAFLKHAPPA